VHIHFKKSSLAIKNRLTLFSNNKVDKKYQKSKVNKKLKYIYNKLNI